jgi:GcrA cell cycle regulator
VSEEFWTQERVDLMLVLWNADQLSTEEIGKLLGCSKNAVIGKARRLGATWRGPVAEPQSEARPLPLWVQGIIAGGCRFPDGDLRQGTLSFCCKPVYQLGAPYCEEHHARCWMPLRSAKTAKFIRFVHAGLPRRILNA